MAEAKKRKGGKRLWIQEATARMARKGTLGSFGRATPSKIARAKARGGLAARRAVFAENVARVARKKARKGNRNTPRR